MSPVSLTYCGISGYAIFWVLFVIAFGLFAQRAHLLWRLLHLGQNENRFNSIVYRIISMLAITFSQWCSLKSVTHKDLAGIGHALMFWGFGLFAIGYFIFIGLGHGFGLSEQLAGSTFGMVYSSILDIVALLIIISIIWAVVKRYIIKPKRLEREATTKEKVAMPLLFSTMFILMVLYYSMEGFGDAAGIISASWSPIGSAFASFLNNTDMSQGTLSTVYKSVWWLNYVMLLGVLVYVPRSDHLHPLASLPNVALRSLTSKGALKPIDFEATETFGAANIQDFTWKQLLDLYACTWCGRCHDACPATSTGKPLDPRELILKLKEHLLEAGPELLKGQDRAEAPPPNPEKALIGEVITEEEIWPCTTCGACVESCPACNDQMGIIIELRRKLVYEGIFDKGHKMALQRVAQDFNPWGIRWHNRAKNIDIEEAKTGEKYDCIYWLGCVASFDERVREVAQATAKILKAAGLRFAILGAKEKCCGDFVRRLGDEGLFQKLASENIRMLRGFDFDFILTHCPHCFNTMKNEYPQFGGDLKVVHHTQLILDLLKEGKIQLQESRKESREKVIYHDPCYLGRYNSIYQEPRQTLRKIFGEIIEFPRNRDKSFCCGAGGGNIWKEQEAGYKISVERMEEAMRAAPQILVTACPFCLLMFQEAIQIKGNGDESNLRDVAEIVERFLY
jgi:Fe-S oxidoreductase